MLGWVNLKRTNVFDFKQIASELAAIAYILAQYSKFCKTNSDH